jgi:alpha-mannosidase
VARAVDVVPHTHWDREWYATFPAFRLALVDLLDELLPLGARMPRPQLVAFLGRLDALAAALEAYAYPELVLDALLLEWPRPSPAGAAGSS